MSKRRDYTSQSIIVAIIVVGLLLLLNLIPGRRIGSFTFKRINIFSDIVDRTVDTSQMVSDDLVIDTSVITENMAAVTTSKLDSARLSMPELKTTTWDISSGSPGLAVRNSGKIEEKPKLSEKEILANDGKIVEIEDFADSGNMDDFYGQLAKKSRERPLRIAVFGDSFIEGDIITADLREQLQNVYGGRGIGFVPLASDVLKFRATVKHASTGWKVSNLLQRKAAPAELRDKFSITGTLSTPADGAFARFEGVTFRKNIKQFSTARLLFINRNTSVINMTVNDSVTKIFSPESSPHLQQISVAGNIRSVKVTVNDPEGFIGYGMVMEDGAGVSVDNYSIRGNSGLALVATNSSINNQLNNAIGIDLIILQYGLNAMAPNVSSYDTYSRQMCKIIDYVKGCFPTSSIMVMSVGDRSTQVEGQFVTMPAVHAMIKAQRNAASKCKVAFWSTFDAMGGEGSMVNYVKRSWAAKDYTHISYGGGKQIALQLVKALVHGKGSKQNNTAQALQNSEQASVGYTPQELAKPAIQ